MIDRHTDPTPTQDALFSMPTPEERAIQEKDRIVHGIVARALEPEQSRTDRELTPQEELGGLASEEDLVIEAHSAKQTVIDVSANTPEEEKILARMRNHDANDHDYGHSYNGGRVLPVAGLAAVRRSARAITVSQQLKEGLTAVQIAALRRKHDESSTE